MSSFVNKNTGKKWKITENFPKPIAKLILQTDTTKNVFRFVNANLVINAAQFESKIKKRYTVIVIEHGGSRKEGLSTGNM